MTNLHDTLWSLTNDDLRIRLKFLDAKAKVTRKAELIDAIKATLEGPALDSAWEALAETEQLAVAEAVYDPARRHHSDQFTAKYGRVAEFHHRPAGDRKYSFYPSADNATRLHVFFYRDRGAGGYFIPHDLAANLRPLCPKPKTPSVPCIPQPTADDAITLRHTEAEALTEIGALLRLTGLGGLRFGPTTGIPAKAALGAIRPLLVAGDWFPPEISNPTNKQTSDQEMGPIKSIGWTRLLHAAGLISMSGAKSALTPTGRRALDQPAWECIADIWQQWASNKLYDEFNRIEVIKGQSVKGSLTPSVPRRSVVLKALAECPVGEWMPFAGFSGYMRAVGHRFEVSHDPWKLYVADREYGSLGYDGCCGWDVLQDRYLLCFLMEYAATLGLIDIAFSMPDGMLPTSMWGMEGYSWLSRYDGLRAFRINPLGAYVLRGGKTNYQPSRSDPQTRLSVLPNRTIRVTSGSLSPAERMHLEIWAEPIGHNTFRADDTRALDAIEAGNDADRFAAFLQERDEQPLPETMEAFLRQARENGGAVRQTDSAILFECRDARTAELLATRKELAKLCLRAGETTLAVRENGLAAFRKHARALGFGIR